jgi:L-histidine N-alpha-methyltransferase
VERFDHVAIYAPARRWIEMRRRARRACGETLPAVDLEVSFYRGEEVRTEISTKFTRPRLESDYAAAGLELTDWLTDAGDRFALSLARAH